MMLSTPGTLKTSLLALALFLPLGSQAKANTSLETRENPVKSLVESASLTSMALHGTAKYGTPGKPFRHFDYVNPDAPKGGSLKMGTNGTFDTLTPYTNKGTPVAGIGLLNDTLMTKSHDEPFSMYPLVARTAQRATDNSSITFILNDLARFHDGVPITAADVKYTFELLTEKGSPFYRSYYSDVETVEVLAPDKVRFNFKHTDNPELPFILAELPVLPRHFWEKPENDFSSASLNPPLGSGPYQIESVDNGRSITYSRVTDYWAKDLPVNVGRNNFDSVRYDYYLDENIALQALKAGEFDLRYENVARNWATAYDVPAVHEGRLILDTIPTRNPAPIQGFVFNQRRPVFQDVNVRKALGYAMDFEWMNRNLFFDSYTRSKSYFGNSEMEATGIPQGDELKLLEPWRKQLQPALFNQAYSVPETDGSGNIRPQIRQALPLLRKAGWSMDQGQLVNQKGQPFQIELLLAQSSMERVALPFKKNLEKMGIELNIRTVDMSQYINRIRNFDYDMIVMSYPQSSSPGNEQKGYWGSQAADTPGSRNYMGIKNPVVDAMIDKVVDARSREELTTAIKALDRVLLWGEYLIPQWYYPYERIAHSSKLVRPQTEALYGTDLYSWWIEDKPAIAEASDREKKSGNHKAVNPWIYSGLALFLVALFLVALFWWIRRKKQP